MTAFGLGDAILKYPGLVQRRPMPERGHHITVHLGSADARKIPPHPERLIAKLMDANANFVLVGTEFFDLPPYLDDHIIETLRARKFVGTLSSFNCIAQVAKIPAFVLVNMSIKDPEIYRIMERNGTIVRAWNTGADSIEKIYDEVVEWTIA